MSSPPIFLYFTMLLLIFLESIFGLFAVYLQSCWSMFAGSGQSIRSSPSSEDFASKRGILSRFRAWAWKAHKAWILIFGFRLGFLGPVFTITIFSNQRLLILILILYPSGQFTSLIPIHPSFPHLHEGKTRSLNEVKLEIPKRFVGG